MTGLNSKPAQLAQGHSQLDLTVFRAGDTKPSQENPMKSLSTPILSRDCPVCSCCLLSSCCVCAWERSPPSSTALPPQESWRMYWGPTLCYDPPFPWAHPAHWAPPHAASKHPNGHRIPWWLRFGRELSFSPIDSFHRKTFKCLNFDHYTNGKKFRSLEAASGNHPFLSLGEFTISC